MSYEMSDEAGFRVLGIVTKASNAAPERIGDLWRRFHVLGGAQAVASRANDAVYSVYCEYEGDFTQPYTVLIGCAVDAAAEVPDGMKVIDVAAGHYAVFQATGVLPKGVMEAWGEIWKTPLDRR